MPRVIAKTEDSAPFDRARRTNPSGFTLVEVLVAMIILVVCLMGLVETWTYMFNATTSTDDRGAAYQCARMVVERAKETGYTLSPLSTTTNITTGSSDVNTPSLAKYRYYTKDLTDLGYTNDVYNPNAVGSLPRYVAVTALNYGGANVPSERPDLQLELMDVRVYQVDPNHPLDALSTAPLYRLQSYLSEGGV